MFGKASKLELELGVEGADEARALASDAAISYSPNPVIESYRIEELSKP